MVGYTKVFDPHLGHSSLPFEGDEDEVGSDYENVPHVPSPPHDILGSSTPLPIDNFTLTRISKSPQWAHSLTYIFG